MTSIIKEILQGCCAVVGAVALSASLVVGIGALLSIVGNALSAVAATAPLALCVGGAAFAASKQGY